MIGPLADSQNNMLGTWAPTGDPKLAIPVLEGFKNLVGRDVNILHAKGANISDDAEFAKKVNVFGTRIVIDERSPESMLLDALAKAKRSDLVIAVVGEATEMSGECASRTNISLPESQKVLIRALAKTGKPLVLINLSGRPLALVEEYNLADAILQTWHLGVEAGNAIADVIFGDYNPSGKLSVSFPRNVGQIPIYYSMRNTGRPQEGESFTKFKSNYLDVENSPLFPFGYGLSYTNFDYSDISLDKTDLKGEDILTARITVTNTGERAGEEVVQLYINDPVASISRPVKELKGFEKIYLEAGESKQVSFEITTESLKFYNGDIVYDWEGGTFNIYLGGNSRDVKSTSVNWEK